MKNIRDWFHHKLNPLHVYCRMRDIGVEECKAKSFGRKYESYIYKAFLSQTINLVFWGINQNASSLDDDTAK